MISRTVSTDTMPTVAKICTALLLSLEHMLLFTYIISAWLKLDVELGIAEPSPLQTLKGVVFMGDIYWQALWTDWTLGTVRVIYKGWVAVLKQLHARQQPGTGLVLHMHARFDPKERSSRERAKPLTQCWLWNMGNHHSVLEKSHFSNKRDMLMQTIMDIVISDDDASSSSFVLIKLN